MKDDGLLYFLTPNGTEYILSHQKVVTTIDYLFASLTTTTFNDESKYLSLTQTTLDPNITVGANSATLNTPGTYFVSYGIFLENTGGETTASSPTATSFIVLNTTQNSSTRRYSASDNYLVANSGNVTYANTATGFITVSTPDLAQIQLTTNTGGNITFSGTNNEDIPYAHFHRIYDQNFTNATFIRAAALVTSPPSGTPTEVSFLALDTYNILLNTPVFTVPTTGYYYVQYNADFDGTGIVGSNPRIDSYIVKNNLDNSSNFKYARNQASVVTDAGVLRYSNTCSDIMSLTANDNLRLKITQTTGTTISFSSATDDKKTHLVLYKLEFIDDQKFEADVAAQTPTSGVRFIVPLTQVAAPNDISLSTNRITFANAGSYLISYTIELDGSSIVADATYESFVAINAAGTITSATPRYGYLSERLITHAGNLRYSVSKSFIIEVTVTDYIEWFFTQTTGQAINVSSANVDQKMRISCSRIK